ncbi:MAG: hypothetical protein IIA49_16555, partial [Bacteroidetes bacterium]|nr:hypothetical protein [Bacteroidota bacterium]
MLMNNNYKINSIVIILASLLFLALYSSGDNNKKKISNPVGININDSYRLEINRIKLPINNRGVIANVSFAGVSEFDGVVFLFSGGFLMSGKNV